MNCNRPFLISLFKQYDVNFIMFKSLRTTSSRNKKVLAPAISFKKEESLTFVDNNNLIASLESSKSQYGLSSIRRKKVSYCKCIYIFFRRFYFVFSFEFYLMPNYTYFVNLLLIQLAQFHHFRIRLLEQIF